MYDIYCYICKAEFSLLYNKLHYGFHEQTTL